MTAHAYALLDSYVYGFALSEASLPINGPSAPSTALSTFIREQNATTWTGSEAERAVSRLASLRSLRSGTFANGMEFLTWGSGPKVLLFISGGPGSSIPKGMMAQVSRRWFDPFVEAGYAVWLVTRRRNMPTGHSVADMADDYAQIIAEYVLPGERSRWVRRLVGPWIGRALLSGKNYPPGDFLVEVEAEISFDSRQALPRIEVPVVLLCGDRDQFFPADVVEETAQLIPDCTLVRYEGQGHMKVANSRRVAQDVLAFVNRN